MFKTTAIDTLKQDKKCQVCWYIILSTMSGSTTANPKAVTLYANGSEQTRDLAQLDSSRYYQFSSPTDK